MTRQPTFLGISGQTGGYSTNYSAVVTTAGGGKPIAQAVTIAGGLFSAAPGLISPPPNWTPTAPPRTVSPAATGQSYAWQMGVWAGLTPNGTVYFQGGGGYAYVFPRLAVYADAKVATDMPPVGSSAFRASGSPDPATLTPPVLTPTRTVPGAVLVLVVGADYDTTAGRVIDCSDGTWVQRASNGTGTGPAVYEKQVDLVAGVNVTLPTFSVAGKVAPWFLGAVLVVLEPQNGYLPAKTTRPRPARTVLKRIIRSGNLKGGTTGGGSAPPTVGQIWPRGR